MGEGESGEKTGRQDETVTGGASEARDLWPFPPLCRIRPANSAQRGQHRAGDRFCSSQGAHVEANPIKSSCAQAMCS